MRGERDLITYDLSSITFDQESSLQSSSSSLPLLKISNNKDNYFLIILNNINTLGWSTIFHLVIVYVGNKRDEICNYHRRRKNDRWI